MAKLVDAHALGACQVTGGGSIPLPGTKKSGAIFCVGEARQLLGAREDSKAGACFDDELARNQNSEAGSRVSKQSVENL